jgi:F0F1-type ATP synthase alpha subunit
LTAATLRKINIPIPTASEMERRMTLQHIDELISMSDGQIWFDESLSKQQQPPIDPQKSITRVGIGADTQSRADAPAIRHIAEGIRLELAQAAVSSMTGVEATNHATRKQLRRQMALLLAMYQPSGSPSRRLSESCTLLLAAREGYLDDAIENEAVAGTFDGEDLMEHLLLHVKATASGIMDEIDSTLDISDESRRQLTESIAEFFD